MSCHLCRWLSKVFTANSQNKVVGLFLLNLGSCGVIHSGCKFWKIIFTSGFYAFCTLRSKVKFLNFLVQFSDEFQYNRMDVRWCTESLSRIHWSDSAALNHIIITIDRQYLELLICEDSFLSSWIGQFIWCVHILWNEDFPTNIHVSTKMFEKS